MDFTIKTKLQRIKELTLKIESYDRIHILFDGQNISAGCYGLAILDAFARPASWEDALLLLKSQMRHPRDWVEINVTIRRLIDKGILVPEAHSIPSFRMKSGGFDAAPIHVKMLNDRLRTTSFLKAINSVVRAGDVVVDIGTGTGVLAVAAARAGARHVYAIETTGIAKIAKEVFAANGLAEKITLIEGRSTRVNLPEKADVMISETVGNHPFGEGILETEGRLNGILSYFELALGTGVRLSTHPQMAGKDNNWKNIAWLLPCPINLLKGEHLSVTFNYRSVNAEDGITVEKIS